MKKQRGVKDYKAECYDQRSQLRCMLREKMSRLMRGPGLWNWVSR